MSKWKPNPPKFIDFKKKVFRDSERVAGFIYQIGELEALRKPSTRVPLNKINSPETGKKINYLKNCLTKYRKLTGYGRGITAVQVGIPEKFSVIWKGQTVKSPGKSEGQRESGLMVVINPKIIKKSKRLLKYPEICMSASPVVAPTIRPAWIEFEYYDDNGKKKYWDTKDDTVVGKMMNRVFQHEIDHMNGIICVDIIKSVKKLILWSDPKFYNNAKFEEV